MRSMTFQVDDQSTGSAIPAVVVTISESADGSLSFTINVVGSYTGDLRGFFFDLANESRIGTLSVTNTSAGFTEFRQGNDNVTDLGNGANMQGLVGSDGGYDAGIEVGTAGIGKDDYQSFSFRLASSAGALTLDDFANVDFGVRLTSVGEADGSRDGAARLLEHTTSAIDALNDANAIGEDAAPNTVSGNVFANDLNLGTSHSVTNPGVIEGTYGTLQLNADGSYIYTLKAAAQGLALNQVVTESFTYSATASDEATSSSSDSATLTITITGANDAPVITSAPQSATVSEGDDGASRSASGQVTFTDVDVLDTHTWSASSALHGAASVDSDGTWHYTVADAGAVDALAVDEFLGDGFAVTVDDGHGGSASQDVAITIAGTNDPIAILFGGGTTDFVEDGGLLGVGAEILFSDVDLNDSHTATAAAAASNTTSLGTFTLAPVSEGAGSAFGSVAWSFAFDNNAAQSLAQGETAVETYTVTVADGHGASASRDVTFRFHGVNDTPDITGGVATGLVYEDGARVARGQLTANDVDHGSALSWSTVSGPAFGFASVNASGQWTYTLDNARFEVQRLAQHETLTDSFIVRATDQFGAFDPQSEKVVTVQIVGTDDRPFVTTPVPPPPPPSVNEDGLLAVSRQATAFDIDNGAQLTWSISRNTALGYLSTSHVTLDEFSNVKNAVLIFDDTFSDGVPPPSAPSFLVPPFAPLSYQANGVFVEAGERLIMDGASTVGFTGVGFNGLVVGHNALLNTNTDPLQTEFGLKSNHDFIVEGTFDLVVPDEPREGYGIQLTDALPGTVATNLLGDDQVSLLVRKSPVDGLVYVQLTNSNTVTDVFTLVDSALLNAAAGDQIRLRLSHDNADPGLVTASFVYLSGGVPTGAGEVLGTTRIFGTDTPGFAGDDEVWTRPGFLSLAPDQYEHTSHLPGTYGTLDIDPTTGLWTYALNNGAANVQALAQGESVADRFHLRVTDQFGLSSSQPLDITVTGTNDTPDITGGATTGLVYEDGWASTARGTLTATDVDHGAIVSWTTIGGPLYGFASVNANGEWTYTLDNTRFQTQQLFQGQMVTDTFTVRAFDQFGAFDAQSEQLVTVTVAGTNDRPNLPPTPLALSASEDGPPAFTATSAFDIDNGATLHWSVNAGSTFGYSAPYEFRADSFSIQKNFAPLFFDDFTAGGPPPQAPDFLAPPPPGGSPATSYSVNGVLEETGGKLVFRGSNAIAFRGTGNDALVVGEEALLNTNTDPLNLQSGLKRNHQFSVEGVFDLVDPLLARQQYGIELTDSFGATLADDLVLLQVRRDTGGLFVRLTNNDSALDTSSLLASAQLLPTSADQIRLRLSHNAGEGQVSASYDLLDHGMVIGGGFLGTAQIFGTDTAFAGDDNNWTRAGLIASALDANELTQTLAGNYGTLTVLPGFSPPPVGPAPSFADLTYTPGSAAQALAQGETAVDTFFVRAVDQFGMTSAQRVDVTVNGVNDAPDITGGVTTGLVYEDGGARAATGVITATDVDHGSTVFWTTVGGPLYGFASVNANGQWTYTLDNTRFQTQQLAQDQQVTDTFVVRASDQFGASDAGSEQVVTVTVVGTNDRPNLPPTPLALSVFEDGFSGSAGTSAFDIDNGAVQHWSLNRGSAFGYFSDYEFRADSFSIQKNFAPLFFDGFDAGGPPPQAPDFLAPPPPGGSSATSYSTTGLFQEVDGKLVFSGANAAAFRGTGNDSLIVGNEAILNTNIDPANTQSGLKRNHQFVIEGVFDLVEPQFVRQQYGLQLTDGFNQLADDLTSLVVRRETTGLFVRLSTNDSVFDTSDLLSSAQLLPSGADQIRLRYSHDAGSGNVSASYELIDNDIVPGMVIGGGTLGSVGIFGTDTAFAGDDNNWIRAGLFANALDPNEFDQVLDGNYGTLTVSNAFLNNVGDLVYTPNNALPAVQALAQGESVTDSFFVRTVDQFGMSSAQQVNITVNGANDAPEIAGVANGDVTEDALAASASGQLTATDVDHFSVLDWVVLGGGFGNYGSLAVDNTGRWTYTLDNSDPDLDPLDLGESDTESFIVLVTDQWGAADDQLVTITVHGADEGGAQNNAPIAAPDNNDSDLVVEAGTAFSGLPFAGDPTASGNVLANDFDPDAGDVLQVVEVNGTPVPAGGSLTLTLTYGSLQIGADGSWNYTLNNDDPDTNALKQMMAVFVDPGFENVTYKVADADGATDEATLSIRVNGTDDKPVPAPDFNSLTESDFPVTVTGNVLANDFDPEGDPLQVFALTLPGRYGTLTLNSNGDYSYTATPSLVNYLGGGEVVHDIFDQNYIVAASSGFGPFATSFDTLLDIAITGTDEPPSTADGSVFEDGGRKTSGTLETTSVDLGAAPVWSVIGSGPNTQTAEYRYLVNNLSIVRNGAPFFIDEFDNGNPSSGTFGATTIGYTTTGIFQEISGRLILDGSFAGGAANGFVAHLATLNTDTTASTTAGLKRNHNFTVEAMFELVMPTEALQTYGLRLTDAGTPGGGDDIVEVSLRRLDETSFAIILRETSTVGGTAVTLASIPFTRLPGEQQIVFTLEHAADSDLVTGSFRVLNGGAVSQSGQFLDAAGQAITANIFGGGQTFTRPQIVGLSPSHAQNGVYGTLSVDADGDWTYSLNNGIQNVQALAQDERVTDSFTVNVTDAHGVSESHTVAVDVFGTNDVPTPSFAFLFPFFSGTSSIAYVVEDGTPQTARGNTFVSDLDHGPRAHFSVTANAIPGVVTPYSSDYVFRLDELSITKNGAETLHDTFDDGFAPGTPSGGDYILTGGVAESGGRAILGGDRATALSGTATSDLLVGNVVLFNTNQRAEDPQRGLKIGHDFTAEARFDFDANFLPAAGQSFGIAFTDRANGDVPPNQLGDDNLYLLVLRDETGDVVAQFSERDSVSDTVSVIGSFGLGPVPLGSQIVLRLEHDTSDLGRVHASFDLLDADGNPLNPLEPTVVFAPAAHGEDRIFGLETPDDPSDDEGWTRFQVIATGRDTNDATVDGQYGTLNIAEDGDWTYALNNAAAQGLARGQLAVDSFNVRAVDAEGASNSRPLNFSVIGTGDGLETPVNAVGGGGSDILVGSSLADLITGNGGSDLLIGLGGSDTYDYNSINDGGGGGGDTIADFTPGAGGDVLDIRDVLVGYTPDPGIFPFNFVQINYNVGPSGMSTQVMVDPDGVGGNYVTLVTLNGVAGLFLSDFMNNGNIILA